MRPHQTPSPARPLSRWGVAGLAVGLAALACGLPFTSGATSSLEAEPTAPPIAPPAQPATVTLKVVNDTPLPICALTLASPDAATPGDNWLGPEYTIPPGGTWALSAPAGTYSLQAIGCNDQTLADEPAFDLSTSQTYTVPAPEGLPPVSEGVIVWLAEDCAQPAIAPGDDVLIRTAWFTSTEDLAEANADHIHFVVSVDDVEVDLQPVRRPAETLNLLDEIGCGPDEPLPLVSWDLPIGRLDAGQHTVSVLFLTDTEIYDGFETYSAGPLGVLDMTFEVGSGGQSPPASDMAVLRVFNDTSDVLCFVRIGPPASEWVDDLLPDGGVLLPDEILEVEIVPGTWALQAEGCASGVLGYEAAYDIAGTVEWHVTGN